ncbi:hypothetical protein KW445_01035 [Vibrio fluvialis]|nr:hypothetical protein [Vibrio fluvialis]
MPNMKKLEFGNYTLTFGTDKVLLDLYDQVVLPSFLEMKFKRKLRVGEYFFLDTEVVKLSDDGAEETVVGICGRIVKNTKLRRQQIFSDGSLVEDHDELETAPSSTFLLILNNHRLVFSKDVPGGPTIFNFMSTSQYFLRLAHKEFITKSFEEAKALRVADPSLKRVTKKSLLEQYPEPELRITPLPDKQSLEAFIRRFENIERLSIKLLTTNKDVIDNDEFWAELDKRKDDMGSKQAKLEFRNEKDGLDAQRVLAETKAATAMGNSEIKFKGYSQNGDRIDGDNNDFDLSMEVEELPKEPKNAAVVQFKSFMHLAATGAIKLPVLGVAVSNKIKAIADRL